MRTSPINRVVDHLRRGVLLPDGAGLGDADLLNSFIERQDKTALTALVKRHGPMVWGVCRRLLSQHDAEDAFQATFLVLVRKAASIRSRELVGNSDYLCWILEQDFFADTKEVVRQALQPTQ